MARYRRHGSGYDSQPGFDAEMDVGACTTVGLLAALAIPAEDDAGMRLRVNRAIADGVAYLRSNDGPGSNALISYPLGEKCLKLYALRVAGVPSDDPLVVELRKTAVAAATQVDHTYTLSLALLGLLAADRAAHASTIVHLVSRLESGQMLQSNNGGAGAWTYVVPRARTGDAPRRDGPSHALAHWSAPVDWWDDSNTQYAILALRAAADFGFEVDVRVFERAARHFIERQGSDGGFGYHRVTRRRPYIAMTAGGLGSLQMCLDLLDDDREGKLLRRRGRAAMKDGLRWMGRRLAFPALDAPWPFYSAYAVERLGHYADAQRLGSHDWYAEGATWLVSVQRGDGSWSSRRLSASSRSSSRRDEFVASDYGAIVDTSFALLFLRRASFQHTQVSDEVTILLEGIGAQFRDDELAVIEQRILKVGEHAIPQLVKGLYLPVKAARAVAARCLRELTGEDMGYLEASDEHEARRAREAWVRYVLSRDRVDVESDD